MLFAGVVREIGGAHQCVRKSDTCVYSYFCLVGTRRKSDLAQNNGYMLSWYRVCSLVSCEKCDSGLNKLEDRSFAGFFLLRITIFLIILQVESSLEL